MSALQYGNPNPLFEAVSAEAGVSPEEQSIPLPDPKKKKPRGKPTHPTVIAAVAKLVEMARQRRPGDVRQGHGREPAP